MEEALRESEEKLRLIFENAFDGINVYEEIPETRSRRLLDCNDRYTEMAGRTKQELLEMANTSSLQRRLGPAMSKEEAQRVRRDRISYKGLISWIRPDNKENIIEYSAAPIQVGDRALTIGLDRDITEHVRTQEALRQQTIELQERNQELDAYAQTVAHDLKAPVTLIGGYAEALHDGFLALSVDQQKEFLQQIVRNVFRISNIIDELLLLAEIRKGDVELATLEMGSIVAEALNRLGHVIEERGAAITAPESWPAALGHGPWIEQVWVNYVSNALTHGGQPPRVELGATVQADGMVCYWVRDRGPGISEEDRERLFTPFVRLAQARAWAVTAWASPLYAASWKS